MDTQLLPYRLKSARRKKRLQIEDRDKQILKLYRERECIWNDPDYETVVPLDESYQRGWKRLFVLKPDIQKSEKAEFCFRMADFWDQHYYRWTYKYVFAFPELFKIAVQPYIVSTVKIGDALMEQRLNFIDDLMDKIGLQYRLWKLKGGKYKYWRSRYDHEKLKYGNPLKNIPVYLAEDHA